MFLKFLKNIPAAILKKCIRGYQLAISPMIGSSCRFLPTCSCYGVEAIEKHGALKGLFLILKRVLSCHPWSRKQGHDPVPKTFFWFR